MLNVLQHVPESLFDRARPLSEVNFKRQKSALQAEARTALGEINTLDVLGQIAARSLAELLPNPRLDAAMRAQKRRSL